MIQSDDKIIEKLAQYQSHKIINEITDDDNRFHFTCSNQALSLENNVINSINLYSLKNQELALKQSFLDSQEYNKFAEMIVISQLRYHNSRSGPEYTLYIQKALNKAIKKLMLKLELIQTKKEFKESYDSIIKLFIDDIKLSYVTSSGQIKSTATIYLNKNISEHLHNQQFLMNFKQEEIKVQSFFSFYKSQINLAKLLPSVQMVDDDSKTQPSTQPEDIPKPSAYLPLCHQNQQYKQAFIRSNKFKNEFLVLSKLSENDMKTGVSIYFVYRLQDDQIYAIKKSRLQSNVLTFQDVFSTFGEQSHDQRKIREAKILAKLTHPNILRLYQWWIEEESDGYSLFMLLDYCSYPGFSKVANDLLNYSYYYLNPLSNKQKRKSIKSIMIQIVDGLFYIHKRGIIHRDLKPENIFVTIDSKNELKILLADFDQGKDVREQKLCNCADGKIPADELNSIKSQNTIQSGTSGYTTPNSLKNQLYDIYDEFYALGIILLHLVSTFPGEPKNRNHYTATFGMSDIEDVLVLFDNWANKYVKNKNKEFQFEYFLPQLDLAKKLLEKKIQSHDQLRQIIKSW